MKLDHTNRRKSRRTPRHLSNSSSDLCLLQETTSKSSSYDRDVFIKPEDEDKDSTESPILDSSPLPYPQQSVSSPAKVRTHDKQKSRNRESAVRHRVRKKVAEGKLDDRRQRLSEDHDSLKAGVAGLMELRLQLKQLMMAHNMCNFAPIDCYHMQCAAEIAGGCGAKGGDQTCAAATAVGILGDSPSPSSLAQDGSAPASDGITLDTSSQQPSPSTHATLDSVPHQPSTDFIDPALSSDLCQSHTQTLQPIDTSIFPTDVFSSSPSPLSEQSILSSANALNLDLESPLTPISDFELSQYNCWNEYSVDDMVQFPPLLQI